MATGSTPPAISRRDRDAAEKLYLEGARQVQQGKIDAAATQFAKAVEKNPQEPEYLRALLLIREHKVSELLQQSARERRTHPEQAAALLQQAHALDPENTATMRSPVELPVQHVRTERLASGIVLLHNSSRHSYHLRSSLRSLAQTIARDYGVQAIPDADLRDGQFRLDVDNASFDDAMRVLNLASDTMYVPLDEHTILLAQDTAQNHQRLERLVEETFFLPGYAQDRLKDFVSIAQTVLNIQRVTSDPGQGAIIVRGPADLADAAERIFSDLLNDESDVVYQIRVYSVGHSKTRNLGVVLPASFTGFNVASEASSIVQNNSSLVSELIANGIIPSGASNIEIAAYLVFVAGVSTSSSLANTFLVFGGGLTMSGVSVANSAAFNLALSRSDANELEDVTVRAGNRQDATFKVGMRYPIQTSLFSDIATSTSSSTATVNGVSLSSLLAQYLGTSSTLGTGSVIPQVQYEDLGLTVTAHPTIQRTGDVTTHLDIKIRSLAGGSLNGIPILANREFSSDLTLRDGDTTMLISNASRSEIASVTGLPGLSDLPGFQSTTNKNGSESTGELVVLVTPHIVRFGHRGATGPYIPLKPRPDTD